MSEKFKISMPMFEVGELEQFDSNIHSIVEEYSKMMFKEKDQILTQRIIMKQEEEIERLNNIINELEEYIVIKLKEFNTPEEYYTLKQIDDIHYRLQELKGENNDKENN